MRTSLKRKLTGSMMLAVLAAMVIVSVCLLLGTTRYHATQFVEDVSAVFTTDLLTEMNEQSTDSAEVAASSVQQTMEAYAGQLGIGAGREYSVWDATTGDYLGGSQETASATNNIITAMNGVVGDVVPLLASRMDVAIPIRGEVSLVVDIQDDGSAMRRACQNMALLLLASAVLSLVMCLLLSWMMANAFAASAVQMARDIRRNTRESTPSSGDWEAMASALSQPGAQRRRRKKDARTQADTMPSVAAYLRDGWLQFTTDGHITQMNAAAESLLGAAFDGDMLFEQVFPGVPMPNETQHMVHGQFTRGEVRLDVVFVAQDSGVFSAILHPIEGERV